ncbi:unnamed protein product [Brassicogethes aeneus]|uniref:Major facilitator superfamily (MFS) profile domain-containing protein n=1 Tax=Brassicogethes aeneus TaxID=1431903 RepID=A0A9P0B6M2_BRAAE|nr:unnamed protein product [Brassicogethes aeneus]
MLLASVITVLMPVACYWHFYAAMASRVLLGMFLGVTYPCIAPLAIKWIPPDDRPKFLSNMMSQGLGVAISLPICGLLISLSGWPSVFYVTGFVGVLWSCFWFYLVYDTPQKHPRISDQELLYIESKIGDVEISDRPLNLPWCKILLSAPAWAIIFSHGAAGFVHFLNITQLPTYMMDVLHFDTTKNGLWSSLPNLGQYLVAIAAGCLWKSKKLSLLTTRKIFAGIATLGPAIVCAFMAVYGENHIVALFSLVTSISLVGAVTAGHLPNNLDISPNFCGTIMGIATTVSSIAGWASTKVVAVFTEKNSTFDSWRNVFWTMSGVSLFGGLFFIIFAKGEVQKWNSVEKEPNTTSIYKKSETS